MPHNLTDEQVELLKKKYDRLLDMTRKMRGHQIQFFKYHSSMDLDKAKQWERQVDSFIKDEVKAKDSQQKELF